MTKKVLLILISLALCIGCSNMAELAPSYTSFVNPFIGTDGPGNTYPGATVPFGMVQLSPDIGIGGWDRIAGYFYKDSIISGFSHMHLSGTGAGDLYDILVMPTNSKSTKKIKENGFRPFSSFSHQKEVATPGYYSVDLLDFDIKAELTASKRVGVHRYTFPKDSTSAITVDLGYALNWDAPTDTYIKVVNDSTIEGYRISTGWAKEQRAFFAMKFSTPFKSFKLYSNDTLVNQNEVKSRNTKIVLKYATKENEQITLKTGLATSSIKGAYLSLQNEVDHKDFETIKSEAAQIWEAQLKKVEIKSTNKEAKTIFYTMMYQSMLAPTLLSDQDGYYKGADNLVQQTNGFDRYDTFSLWDTYRAAHPLYTILHTPRVSDMINSLLAHYNETGLLPVWSMQGNETNMMIGYHAVPVIVDAYFKGVENFNTNLAYEACKTSAMDTQRQIPEYIQYGYIPIDEHHENWSVSKTLEYAYDDWCIAQFAKDLGKTDDYTYFLNRSENWRNMYDERSTFMRPKKKNGDFIEDFVPKEYSPYFCESNAWQYFWYVPQNIDGLIDKTGGLDRFEKKLDSMFNYDPLPGDELPIFSTGMIGQYAHGNEPSHHVGYLYNYIDKPWKTQKIIREITTTQYKNAPNGHCGNEDCGQMSSWYIFSSLGFYPVNPAQGIYAIGSPLFENAIMNLPNGNSFEIETSNNSANNKYIQSVLLNGKPLERSYLRHSEIMNGGKIAFTMGSLPNKTLFKDKKQPQNNVYQ